MTTAGASSHTLRNIVVKALALFIAANLVYAAWYPAAGLGKLSAYNRLFPGRTRLPYGDHPDRSYNVSLFNLEALFAAHEISAGPKPDDEYRVILIGDSATWGFLLPPYQTLSAYLNRSGYRTPDSRQVRFYNLGYPVMSVTKDLLLLSYALRYEPDLVVWPLTLESLPYDKQLYPPLLQHNLPAVRRLAEQAGLALDLGEAGVQEPGFWQRTIIGDRRNLADLVRLQFYGAMWAATGVDQEIPEHYTPRQEDLEANPSFHNLQPPHLNESDLALEALRAGVQMAAHAPGDVPVLLVNEPMFVSQGENSNIRYNFFYPRWAYDDYRAIMAEASQANGWNYLDAWDAISSAEFTNSAVHLSPAGTQQFAQILGRAILTIANAR